MSEYDEWCLENIGTQAPMASKEDTECIVVGYYKSITEAIIRELAQRLDTPDLYRPVKLLYQRQLEQFTAMQIQSPYSFEDIPLLERTAVKFQQTDLPRPGFCVNTASEK